MFVSSPTKLVQALTCSLFMKPFPWQWGSAWLLLAALGASHARPV